MVQSDFTNLKCQSKLKIKSKFICNGWGIAFYGEGLWGFCNDFARNIVIFGVDNSSWYHINNQIFF